MFLNIYMYLFCFLDKKFYQESKEETLEFKWGYLCIYIYFFEPLFLERGGKNTGVGCHSLLQEIFPTQGLNPGLLHCKQTLYCLSHQEVISHSGFLLKLTMFMF